MQIRTAHFWYDLRAALSDPKLLIGLLVVAGFFILYIDFGFIYPTAVLFMAIVASRALIGRRCPRCDRRLQEIEAKPDKQNAFVLHIIWRCPHDGYEETEETKGDSGLFGAS